MMTTEDIRIGIELLGFVGMVFAVGRAAGRVEVAVKRVEKLETHLDRIPAIEQAQRFTESRLAKMESHHRELAEKYAETRGRMASQSHHEE